MESDTARANKPFNSKSTDAMFATVLARLDQQDKEAREYRANLKADVAAVLAQVTTTNGRVTALERWRDLIKAKITLVVLIGSGLVSFVVWAIQLWANKG